MMISLQHATLAFLAALVGLFWFYLLARLVSWGIAKSQFDFSKRNKAKEEGGRDEEQRNKHA